VTTGNALYSAPTAALTDPALTDALRAKQVRKVADLGFSTDGIMVDASGAVLITNVSGNGIASVDPASGTVSMIAANEGVWWSDTVTVMPDGAIAFSSSNTSDHFAGAVKAGEERYKIWRIEPQN